MFHLSAPFIIKLQSVFSKQRRHELPDHRLGLLSLIPSQHADVGHQPSHSTDGHAAHLPLDVISDLLHSSKE